MKDGTNNILERAEKTIRLMAECGMSHSAKDIKDLIQYAKALDKNQKALIKLMLKYKRANETYDYLIRHIVKIMDKELRYVEDVWTTKEGDEIDTT